MLTPLVKGCFSGIRYLKLLINKLLQTTYVINYKIKIENIRYYKKKYIYKKFFFLDLPAAVHIYYILANVTKKNLEEKKKNSIKYNIQFNLL